MAIGPRPSGSPANAKTRQYITAQIAALGIKTVEQPFDGATPIGPIKMVNLIGTIPGRSADRIILASHFDTKLYRDVRFVGASDGASSTAALLELARGLKARKDLPFTIELLFFDGEEAVGDWPATDSTYGSRHYVEAASKSGSLKSIARARAARHDRRPRPYHPPRPQLHALAHRHHLGHREQARSSPFMDEETAIEDDHLPFLKAGVPAVDIIDLEYPAWHTPQDTMDAIAARSLQIVGDVVRSGIAAN